MISGLKAAIDLDDGNYKFVISKNGEPLAKGVYSRKELSAGDIVLGVVRERLGDKNAIFVEIGDIRTAYLPSGNYKTGERGIFQIKNTHYSTKGAKLTEVMSLSGTYAVCEFRKKYDISTDKPKIFLSKKVEGEQEQKRIRDVANAASSSSAADIFKSGFTLSVIVRTAAISLDSKALYEKLSLEIRRISDRFLNVIKDFDRKKTSSNGERLMSGGLFSYFNNVYRISDFDDVVVGSAACKAELVENENISTDAVRIAECSGFDIFSVDQASAKLPKLLGRVVYLKCGGEIVIEKTEAMTVIDVNAKNAKITDTEVNYEAGEEVMRQLMLRNIGGIVMCDFINMSEKDSEDFTEFLVKKASEDYAKCTVYGFTKLGVMEIARKRCI